MAKQRLLAGPPPLVLQQVAPQGTPGLPPAPGESWDDMTRVVKRKGVSWSKKDSKWKVALQPKGSYVWLGRFTSEAAAMRTFDRVALAATPGAETNFPSSDYSEEVSSKQIASSPDSRADLEPLM